MLEPGPVYAKDGDKNRSEQINYRILRGLNYTFHTFFYHHARTLYDTVTVTVSCESQNINLDLDDSSES